MTASVSSLRALPALRRAIVRLLEIDSRTISLIPQGKTEIANGGIYDTVAQTSRAPQKFLLEAYNIYGYNTIADIGADGDFKRYYQMTGAWDAVVAIGDHWEDGDTKYRVISILPKNDYETRCLVIGFGKDPNYG